MNLVFFCKRPETFPVILLLDTKVKNSVICYRTVYMIILDLSSDLTLIFGLLENGSQAVVDGFENFTPKTATAGKVTGPFVVKYKGTYFESFYWQHKFILYWKNRKLDIFL